MVVVVLYLHTPTCMYLPGCLVCQWLGLGGLRRQKAVDTIQLCLENSSVQSVVISDVGWLHGWPWVSSWWSGRFSSAPRLPIATRCQKQGVRSKQLQDGVLLYYGGLN